MRATHAGTPTEVEGWPARTVGCPRCGAPDGRLLWSRHGFRWLRCQVDGMAWVTPQLTAAAIDGIYRRVDERKAATLGAPPAGEGGAPAPVPDRYRRVLRRLADQLGGPGRLLEVGAFDGGFLAAARGLGWTAEGTEINDAALGRARARGLTMHAGRLEELHLPPGAYDAVVLRDVLEHVPDPLAELRRLHGLLRPGGLLYVWVPNLDSLTGRILGGRWGAVVFPWHLSYVGPASLAGLLGDAGFRVERVASRNLLWRRHDPWEILQGRAAPPGAAARRQNRALARLLNPAFAILDRLGLHLGAQLEVHARR